MNPTSFPTMIRRGRHVLGMLLLVQYLVPMRITSEPVPSEPPASGFEIPEPGRKMTFPRDHGSHPGFALEWWYVTGRLFETNGVRHGFQATFFRRAGSPGRLVGDPATPSFGNAQLFLGHMALLNGESGEFLHQERLNREGWDAAAAHDALEVRNGNWSLQMRRGTETASGSVPELDLVGSVRAEASFSLRLTARKPLVIFGTNGVSRKGAEPWAASHYLTFPRLSVSGDLVLGGKVRPVRGEAWMDHEFSSSQLGSGQVGWDWAGIQLRDGRELMAYRMRRSDGGMDPFSTLAWVDREGGVRQFGPSEFRWVPEGEWRSPATGARYPARVRLTTRDPETGRDLTLLLEPVRAAQELTGSVAGIAYWEGDCRVLDPEGRELGSAFLEMTGYGESLSGRL